MVLKDVAEVMLDAQPLSHSQAHAEPFTANLWSSHRLSRDAGGGGCSRRARGSTMLQLVDPGLKLDHPGAVDFA